MLCAQSDWRSAESPLRVAEIVPALSAADAKLTEHDGRAVVFENAQDMVRICDGRMSGTGYGTIVLHVTPESAVGGPLAHVKTGDRIRLSVKNREISLLVSAEELAQRAKDNPVIEPTAARSYKKLFLQTVTQADKGVDFDFLRSAEILGKTPRA